MVRVERSSRRVRALRERSERERRRRWGKSPTVAGSVPAISVFQLEQLHGLLTHARITSLRHKDMKNIQHQSDPVHVGIDVAKATLQVDLQGKSHRFLNTKPGRKTLLEHLPERAFVIMEATGSYHMALMELLHSAAIPVAVVNPARVKQFARARGTIAKTDPVDAALLSAFGQALAPTPTPPQDSQRLRLKELVNLRDALVAEITRWKGLREHQQSVEARHIAAIRIAGASKALASVQQRIVNQIKESETLSPVARVLQDCQGVGLVTGAVLVSQMPELGRIGRRQAAALAGLAPYANDSGKHQGKRMTRGGRPRLKRALYLASLTALRYHPTLKVTYQELRKSGKPAKVAITAIARRLLVILNAKLKAYYATVATPI